MYVQLYILNTNIVGTFLRMSRILVHVEAGSDGARFQKPAYIDRVSICSNAHRCILTECQYVENLVPICTFCYICELRRR